MLTSNESSSAAWAEYRLTAWAAPTAGKLMAESLFDTNKRLPRLSIYSSQHHHHHHHHQQQQQHKHGQHHHHYYILTLGGSSQEKKEINEKLQSYTGCSMCNENWCVRVKKISYTIYWWKVHSLRIRMCLLRMWGHCNLWLHSELNRNSLCC